MSRLLYEEPNQGKDDGSVDINSGGVCIRIIGSDETLEGKLCVFEMWYWGILSLGTSWSIYTSDQCIFVKANNTCTLTSCIRG